MNEIATDQIWAALREHAAGFASVWDCYRQASGYEAELPSSNIGVLADYFVDTWPDVRDEYYAVAEALERLLETLDQEMADLILVIGFMEELIPAAEEAAIPLDQLYEPLGRRGREAWAAAYEYTHSGKTWQT